MGYIDRGFIAAPEKFYCRRCGELKFGKAALTQKSADTGELWRVCWTCVEKQREEDAES